MANYLEAMIVFDGFDHFAIEIDWQSSYCSPQRSM